MMTILSGPTDGVIFTEEVAGSARLGVIALNNPRALNALTLEMFHAMERQLLSWREREEIACVVLHAPSPKAFCAGGDVKALVSELTRTADIDAAAAFFTAEYFVDYLTHVYPKPILCWADGITMGGGIGIMNGASSRVVTERTIMAMPEIAIGFFPDVGGTHFLNRMPEGLGMFLGLTSARFDGADAVAIGMADFAIAAAKKGEVLPAYQSFGGRRTAPETKICCEIIYKISLRLRRRRNRQFCRGSMPFALSPCNRPLNTSTLRCAVGTATTNGSKAPCTTTWAARRPRPKRSSVSSPAANNSRCTKSSGANGTWR